MRVRTERLVRFFRNAAEKGDRELSEDAAAAAPELNPAPHQSESCG